MFSFYMPTKIFFGSGCLNTLLDVELPGTKALIITSGTSTTKLGYVDRVQKLLSDRGIESLVYNKVKPNPTTENVSDCAFICRQEKCNFIIGLGGGSSIDAAKATAIMATNAGEYWDYIAAGTGKKQTVKNNPLPIIAITTTAGTGTEADPWTVITNEKLNEKIGYGYDKTFPCMSFVDPDLMMTVPADLTAYQGFDALFHSTEGYISNIANPISDMYALKAIELIGENLATAVNDGSNMQARASVALANTLSGFVESTSSCTSEHALEHALSAFHTDLAHGAGLIMISLEYYKCFLTACPERFIDMAKALGNKQATKPEHFIEILAQLQEKCNVNSLKMSDYNVDKSNLSKYVTNAFDNMGKLMDRDRKKLSHDDFFGIFERSYK